MSTMNRVLELWRQNCIGYSIIHGSSMGPQPSWGSWHFWCFRTKINVGWLKNRCDHHEQLQTWPCISECHLSLRTTTTWRPEGSTESKRTAALTIEPSYGSLPPKDMMYGNVIDITPKHTQSKSVCALLLQQHAWTKRSAHQVPQLFSELRDGEQLWKRNCEKLIEPFKTLSFN